MTSVRLGLQRTRIPIQAEPRQIAFELRDVTRLRSRKIEVFHA
jgi:hypothetical protein